jgi:hypothetical protein
VWRFEGNKPMGKHRRRWEDNITMDLQEMSCGNGIDLCDSA